MLILIHVGLLATPVCVCIFIVTLSLTALQLLGMNVSDARRSAASGRWGGDVVKHIGRHMLEAIAGVHKLGFIHRDIKPANFALTPRHVPITEGQLQRVLFPSQCSSCTCVPMIGYA